MRSHLQNLTSILLNLRDLPELFDATPVDLVLHGARSRGLVDLGEAVVLNALATRPQTEQDLLVAQNLAKQVVACGSLPFDLSAAEVAALEVFILLAARPALPIQDHAVTASVPHWPEIAATGARFTREVIPAIGRLARADHVGYHPCGTGFLVTARRVLTNNHVVGALAGLDNIELWRTDPAAFKMVVARLNLLLSDKDQRPEFDRRGEMDRSTQERSFVARVEWCHPKVDVALLALSHAVDEEGEGGVVPLKIGLPTGAPTEGRRVAVIGYPLEPPSGEAWHHVQQILGESAELGVKRLSPAVLGPLTPSGAVSHDGATLRGSSGSAIVDFQTCRVLAVHASGDNLMNYGVALGEHLEAILNPPTE